MCPQCPAMRLQQSRSAAVIAIAGMRQAIIGVANTRSNSNETPTLPIGFICLEKYRSGIGRTQHWAQNRADKTLSTYRAQCGTGVRPRLDHPRSCHSRTVMMASPCRLVCARFGDLIPQLISPRFRASRDSKLPRHDTAPLQPCWTLSSSCATIVAR